MNSDVNDTAFVLGHGARHGSWQRAATQHAPLADAGAGAARVAAGLPEHGFSAPLPSGYPLPGRAGPLTGRASSPAATCAARSQLTGCLVSGTRRPMPQPAGVTMGECTRGVWDTLRRAGRHRRLVLVAHRAGGTPAWSAAPCAPGPAGRIACLCASVPAGRPRLSGHPGTPENATARRHSLSPGDPQPLDAVRTDPLQPDSACVQELRQARSHGTPAGRFDRRRSALGPGLPPAVPAAPAALATARWGRIPRAFWRRAQDRALPTAAQGLMTAEAGRAVPGAPSTVPTLPAGRSPIADRPRELAGTLVR
ncbi:alpha/beta fold hydrolase [Streptomyces yatensis]|uniref:Alpha/beta fold hydrolase n=2 Tax=Streptomyces yatensis TaxID=155177 RepID=A0ABP4UHE8_9ACTN